MTTQEWVESSLEVRAGTWIPVGRVRHDREAAASLGLDIFGSLAERLFDFLFRDRLEVRQFLFGHGPEGLVNLVGLVVLVGHGGRERGI